MSEDSLFKGFEVELFTGTSNTHVGISNEIEKIFPNFVKEPDNRNIEYITKPSKNFQILYEYLITPRKKLREWLKKNELTIIPSSTLCYEHDSKFQRSDISNAYHQFIESNYGISIATSSVHINLGIDNLQELFSAIRLARCEAPLYLAISASSPFLNGKFTGNHSQRWIQFPKTPKEVPFFENHYEYISWIDENIKNANMHNIRHFWSSIRPNGPDRPHKLDRLELRICDFIADIDLLLAVTALLELRTLFLFQNSNDLDPMFRSNFSQSDLTKVCAQNELNVAKNSLNAELTHWRDGKLINCKQWIKKILDEVYPLSISLKMQHLLKPIYKVLAEGNKSMKWIKQYNQGITIEEIMRDENKTMIESEDKFI